MRNIAITKIILFLVFNGSFIFCNTVVIPPTLQSAFHLSPQTTFVITQYAFLLTALACLLQAFIGHKRSVMEGPTGLWWATIFNRNLVRIYARNFS